MNRTLPTLDDVAVDASAEHSLGALETPRGRLPLVALDVRAKICDLAAQTLVRQTFRNALDEPLEATYIFPLPERAAVTKFVMIVGDRRIEGDLQEREAAREEYERAIEAGHQAAIAEEERSGVFTLRVGNLPPETNATVELTLAGPLAVVDDEATFRFPLVVAPRYTAGIPLDGGQVGDGVQPDTDQVPDASRVSPPVLLPGVPNPVRLSLSVEIEPCDAAASISFADAIKSSLHSVISDAGPPYTITLQAGERLNCDFVLRFPVAKAAISTSLKASAAPTEKPGVFSLTVVPPALGAAPPRPRNVVFVLDRSGSMNGWKMVAARRAVARMVDTLLEQDRFAVLAFDDQIDKPAEMNFGLAAASDRRRWRVLEWLGKVESRGGTELRPALVEALRMFDAASDKGAQPILVIVTDGQVTGEDIILQRLRQQTGVLPRIFTVGIDQAVNAGFLQRVADMGLGQCELVESEDRLDEAMGRIHRLLGLPVLTQLRLEPLAGDMLAETFTPQPLPDLFAGRPLTIYGRHLSRDGKLALRLHGLTARGETWCTEIEARPAPAELLTSMWGRSKVRALEDEYAAGGVRNLTKLMEQIVAVSLEAHVLSRFTAYVAVDRSQVVNAGGEQAKIVQPVEMPAEWEETEGVAMQCMSFGYDGHSNPNIVCSDVEGPTLLDGLRAGIGKLRRRLSAPAASMRMYKALLPQETPAHIPLDANHPAIARLVEEWITDALRQHVTEIAIEPQTSGAAVSFLFVNAWQFRETLAPQVVAAVTDFLRQKAGTSGNFVVCADEGDVEVTVRFTAMLHGEMIELTLAVTAVPSRAPRSKTKFWA